MLLLWRAEMQRLCPGTVLRLLLLLQFLRRLLLGLPQEHPVRINHHLSTSVIGHRRSVHPHLCPGGDRSRWTTPRRYLRGRGRVQLRYQARQIGRHHPCHHYRKPSGVSSRRFGRRLDRSFVWAQFLRPLR